MGALLCSIARGCAPLALALALAAVAVAQDSVQLVDKRTLRGDVTEETADSVTIVDGLGNVQVVAVDRIAAVKRGAPLSAAVLAKLAAIDAREPDRLYAVALFALEEVRSKADGQRLLRRVLALAPEHAGARERLGHVNALGVWYANAKDADAAVRKAMVAEGRVQHAGGWVLRADKAALAGDPGAWMLADGHRWRKTAEVMAERGATLWNGEWYLPEDAALLALAREWSERSGGVLHAAREGPCDAVSALGREHARATAARLARTREWFMDTFAPRGLDFRSEMRSTAVVLADGAAFERLCRDHAAFLGLDAAGVDYAIGIGNCLLGELGMVVSATMDSFEFALVSAHGHTMFRRSWRSSLPLPEWLWAACAHHAEVEILHETRMQYVAGVEFGAASDMPPVAGRDRAAWQRHLQALRGEGRLASIGELLALTRGAVHVLDSRQDTLAFVLLDFLATERRGQLQRFVNGGESADVAAWFELCFEQTPEDMDRALARWLGWK